jgi:hypothetical protein
MEIHEQAKGSRQSRAAKYSYQLAKHRWTILVRIYRSAVPFCFVATYGLLPTCTADKRHGVERRINP